ncbi:MAG TPA: hypothetical protein VMI54_16795 [Polyangiaceae bacterium]|nr:hypothetical protein [Polyangiaceae bacterium]
MQSSTARAKGLAVASVALAGALAACSDGAPRNGQPHVGAPGSGGAAGAHVATSGANAPSSGAGTPGTVTQAGSSGAKGLGGAPGSAGAGPGTSPTTGSGGVTLTGGGGVPSVPAAGAGAIPTGGGGATVASAGSGVGGATHTSDHCVDGYDPDPSDSSPSMLDGPSDYVESGQTDTIVQPQVLAWLQSRKWESAHFEWHSIRRCTAGTSMSEINICSHTDLIPANQECLSDGDGLEFLAMHHHMLVSLRQLWPNHQEQFKGFDTFPQSADDVPPEWRDAWSSFSADELANAKIADEIDKPENLSKFASEGAFGRWLQCQTPTYSGLHGALHFKWVRTQNTTHGLGNQKTNIDNYMFWKLHGWIDNVWFKYRAAKGLAPDDPALVQQVQSQCYQMDELASLIDPSLVTEGSDNTALPEESGVFVTNVRPMFEDMNTKCSGCHGPDGPEAGMTLGGHVSSADIVKNLVNVQSEYGGQYLRVKPGDPDHSWLYLKAAALADGAGCMESAAAQCRTDAMPPTGSARPTSDQLQALHDWILSGAPAPTSP